MGGFFKKAFTLKGLGNVALGFAAGGPIGAAAGAAATGLQAKTKLDAGKANKAAKKTLAEQAAQEEQAKTSNVKVWLLLGALGIGGASIGYFLARRGK